MAATLGNSFWKKRTKHGRDQIFKSSDILWDAACEYFQHNQENPWHKNEAIKSGDLAGSIVSIPVCKPLTIEGLCIFLDVGKTYFNDFEKVCTKDFSEVIDRIKLIIYTNKFEGATVGAFNANIISRELGLIDKTQSTVVNASLELTDDEAERLKKKFDDEF